MSRQVSLIINRIKEFVQVKLNSLVSTNTQIAFLKPFATRYLDNKIDKIEKFLYNFADKEGNIDIEGIVDETVENLISKKKAERTMGETEKIIIEDGKIKIDLPFINKQVILDNNDLQDFIKMF